MFRRARGLHLDMGVNPSNEQLRGSVTGPNSIFKFYWDNRVSLASNEQFYALCHAAFLYGSKDIYAEYTNNLEEQLNQPLKQAEGTTWGHAHVINMLNSHQARFDSFNFTPLAVKPSSNFEYLLQHQSFGGWQLHYYYDMKTKQLIQLNKFPEFTPLLNELLTAKNNPTPKLNSALYKQVKILHKSLNFNLDYWAKTSSPLDIKAHFLKPIIYPILDLALYYKIKYKNLSEILNNLVQNEKSRTFYAKRY